MTLREARVGMRVVCVEPYDGYANLVGEVGEIKFIHNGSIAVEFDNPFDGGHMCSRRCKPRHGRWGSAECLEPESVAELPDCISISFDDIAEG